MTNSIPNSGPPSATPRKNSARYEPQRLTRFRDYSTRSKPLVPPYPPIPSPILAERTAALPSPRHTQSASFRPSRTDPLPTRHPRPPHGSRKGYDAITDTRPLLRPRPRASAGGPKGLQFSHQQLTQGHPGQLAGRVFSLGFAPLAPIVKGAVIPQGRKISDGPEVPVK
jgi:hypothetical protein